MASISSLFVNQQWDAENYVCNQYHVSASMFIFSRDPICTLRNGTMIIIRVQSADRADADSNGKSFSNNAIIFIFTSKISRKQIPVLPKI